jgi:TolB-like protein/DNA-binding winged helix-turn-helix (wHTH) protein/Tfp pilus assembly protein PilF
MPELKRPPIRFGIFEVDLEAGELRRQGLKVKLQQQPFQILAMLLESPGAVVTREELQKRLWPTDTFVDFDRGLNRATNRLRESLRDEADNPRFIETLPRRGYRFIGQIEKLDGGGSAPDLASQQESSTLTNRSWASLPFGRVSTRQGFSIAIIGLALLTLAAWLFVFRPRDAAIQSVAVLPFVNASSDSDAEYLSDGITESVINNLSQLPNLRVMARSTVFHYKGKDADPQKIGKDLRVQAVLSGRLLQQGNVLIIQAELMDVKTGAQLWGGQFNRGLDNVLSLQDDLSREIAAKLRLKLTGDERQRLAKRYTEDAEAYQFYLKGQYYWNKRSPGGAQKAVSYFEQAIDKDPAYALAYAGLADAYTYVSFFNLAPPRDAMPRAKAAAMKALEIDEHLAEAHVSLGYISFAYDWDWSAAGQHFDQALALNPTLTRAHNFYPLYLSSRGMEQQALAVAKAALDLDPASPSVSHYLALQLYLARQFDQAIEQCHKTLELDPNFAIAYQVLGQAYLAQGINREAEPVLEKYAALSQGSADSLALLGYSHARLGERSQALRKLDELKATSKKSYVPAFYFAMIYAALEDKDQAFVQLEKGYNERFARFAYLKLEALWDPLRSDERFSDLVRRVGIPP